MFEWISTTMASLGSAGVALLMFLENVFPPIPSELIMPLAGFLSERGQLGFWPAVLAGTVGSLAGAVGWYCVGRSVGERRLRAWVDDHGRWLTLSCGDLDRTTEWFERHGAGAVFVGRLVPGVRTFISVPAGFAQMRFLPFVLYSALGTALWTGALALAGRWLGRGYDRVSAYLEPVSWAVLTGVLLLYIYRVIRWRRSDAPEERETAHA